MMDMAIAIVLAVVLVCSPCFAHEDSDAFSLNTYFLSTSTFSLVPENPEKGLYNFTFPLVSAPPVMPVLHPSKSGMQHAFLNTAAFFKDLAFLGVASAGKGFIHTGVAAAAQVVDPAEQQAGCHDQVLNTCREPRQAPTSVLLGLSGTDAMAVFDMMDVSVRQSDGMVVMMLRLVKNPHLMSEFESHAQQNINHKDEHYHFFPNGGFSLDSEKLLQRLDTECKEECSSTQRDRQAVVFLKGTIWQAQNCVQNSDCTQDKETKCYTDFINTGDCLCLYAGGTNLLVSPPAPILKYADGTRVTGTDLSDLCASGDANAGSICVGAGSVCTKGGAGDPHFVGFDGTKYEVGESKEAKGHVYSIISTTELALNSLFDSAPGPQRWPFWGTWMRAFGFKSATGATVEVGIKAGLEFPEIINVNNVAQNRSVLPAGGFKDTLYVKVKGEPADEYIESGRTMVLGRGVSLHFPRADQKHPKDPTDGPVVILNTPEIQVTMYLETEEIAHMDFAVQLLGGVTDMHGLLGQTIRWKNAGVPKAVQGAESQYIVDSLTATEFEYSLFGRGAHNGRSLLSTSHFAGIVIGGGSMGAVAQTARQAREP